MKRITILSGVALVALLFLPVSDVLAAPPPTGACCNIVSGCCPPLGSCSIQTSSFCEFGYQGDGTTCPVCATTTTTITTTTTSTTTTLPATTTTTLPPVSICGDANGDFEITSADALIALKTAVGNGNCPLERCDYNGSEEITSADALLILKTAVGQPTVPHCPVVI